MLTSAAPKSDAGATAVPQAAVAYGTSVPTALAAVMLSRRASFSRTKPTMFTDVTVAGSYTGTMTSAYAGSAAPLASLST